MLEYRGNLLWYSDSLVKKESENYKLVWRLSMKRRVLSVCCVRDLLFSVGRMWF